MQPIHNVIFRTSNAFKKFFHREEQKEALISIWEPELLSNEGYMFFLTPAGKKD